MKSGFIAVMIAGLGLCACTGTNDNITPVSGVDKPEDSRFTKVVLDQNLNEPMELDLLPDGRIIFIERRGAVRIYDPVAAATKTIANIDVAYQLEDGLLGLALDPDYATNHWVYLFYSPPGDEAKQHVSRFVLDGDNLDLASEKILLVIHNQRDQCCHSAGSLEFGPEGNLFISVGDNTNPFASDGFNPIDERKGPRLCENNNDTDNCDRSPWDAQKSSANPNDLRGKILRIHPEPDGTYSIPEGNLFPEGQEGTRPEIYVMGNRNPFRAAIDFRTGYLYWGEVGPDAGENRKDRGPKGHDEVNQARGPGFFGWPYFVGDNKAYHEFDFATGTSGPLFDPAAPVNNSPNNTGIQNLPPAQPAFIWYPYDSSEEFPLVGEGGRNAMAGGVYYYDDYQAGPQKYPRYYDGKLFIYDWIRGWIMVVTMDENGDYESMERFMPDERFNNPIDMRFASDGTIYLIEYGTNWNTQNLDARLVHLVYTAGNRMPVARIEADAQVGAAPLTVRFSAAGSTDDDGDALTYAWNFGEGADARPTGETASYTFTESGIHKAGLTVTDAEGLTSITTVDILVGNTPPEVSLDIAGNSSFFWPGRRIAYSVTATDAEDGSLASGGIAPERVALTASYLERGWDRIVAAQGHQAALEASAGTVGKALMDQSDCASCHQPEAASVGPSYAAIAERYRRQPGIVATLVDKVIKGGAGNWGEQGMAAHPQLEPEQVERMIQYILSVGQEQRSFGERLPVEGTYTARTDASGDGRYIFSASYTDDGGTDIGPMTARDVKVLRLPRVQAESFNEGNIRLTTIGAGVPGVPEGTGVLRGRANDFFAFEGIDLTGVTGMTAMVMLVDEGTVGGGLEVRLDAVDGPLLARFDLAQGPETLGLHPYEAAVDAREGVHDLYFVFTDPPREGAVVGGADWIEFAVR